MIQQLASSLALAASFLIPPSYAGNCVPKTSCVADIPLHVCQESVPYSPNITLKQNIQLTAPIVASAQVVEAPKPTITPTIAPEPTLPPDPTEKPTPTPESAVAANQDGLNPEVILSLINNHRSSKGLPAFQTDIRLCEIAQARTPDLHNEMFGNSYIHAGFNQQTFDWWITENMVHQPTETAAVKWWLSSSLHRRAIESTAHTHSCGACAGYTCIQLFTGWQER
jgi:uncharacterized protein YkwD